MRRREFITLLGGAAGLRPLAARAESGAMPVIGLLLIGGRDDWDFAGFRQGLADAGYVEGQSIAIEYRWADGDAKRLPDLAADLVRRQVAVLVPLASGLAIEAAKAATGMIPIVFGFGGDPVALGLVQSIRHPGGNITGMISLSGALVSKQLGLLHELLPNAKRLGLLSSPQSSTFASQSKEAEAAARSLGVSMGIFSASNRAELDALFAQIAKAKPVDGLVVGNDPILVAERRHLAELVAHVAIPALYPFREQAEAGGLMSYGPNLRERDREVGHYVARVLKGEKPADLPVEQSSKFELVLNLKSAKALGLTVPNSMQLLADDVIE